MRILTDRKVGAKQNPTEPRYIPSKGPVAPTFSALTGVSHFKLPLAFWKVSQYKGVSQLHCRLSCYGGPLRLCDGCWVIPKTVRSVSVRSKWAGLGAQEGIPSAPQPIANVCQRFPSISYDNPAKKRPGQS